MSQHHPLKYANICLAFDENKLLTRIRGDYMRVGKNMAHEVGNVRPNVF